jgi:hypothetical protein
MKRLLQYLFNRQPGAEYYFALPYDQIEQQLNSSARCKPQYTYTRLGSYCFLVEVRLNQE